MSRSRSMAHTFPSPIFPVRAAAATMSTIFSAWLESTKRFDLHLGDELDLVLGASERLVLASLSAVALHL